mmetsp:Transcript_70481/g.204397  ORF Transcript_70481/g.204397 Transcript_70481/m.204397 type:complete len:273 (+) Transcript_70481:408-1226(+)
MKRWTTRQPNLCFAAGTSSSAPSSRARGSEAAGGASWMSFCRTKLACGHRMASPMWPCSSSAMPARSPSVASSMALCTSRQPCGSCDSSQTCPRTAHGGEDEQSGAAGVQAGVDGMGADAGCAEVGCWHKFAWAGTEALCAKSSYLDTGESVFKRQTSLESSGVASPSAPAAKQREGELPSNSLTTSPSSECHAPPRGEMGSDLAGRTFGDAPGSSTVKKVFFTLNLGPPSGGAECMARPAFGESVSKRQTSLQQSGVSAPALSPRQSAAAL